MGANQSSIDATDRKHQKHEKKLLEKLRKQQRKQAELLQVPHRNDVPIKRKSFDFHKGRSEEEGPLVAIADPTRHGQPLVVANPGRMGILELESLFAAPYVTWFRRIWQSLAVASPQGKVILPFTQFRRWTRLPEDPARLLYDTFCRIDAVFPSKGASTGEPVDGCLSYTRMLLALAVICCRPTEYNGPAYLVPTVPSYIDSLGNLLKVFCHPRELSQQQIVKQLGFLADLDPSLTEANESGGCATQWAITGAQLLRWIELAGFFSLHGIEAWQSHPPNDQVPDFELPLPKTVVPPIIASSLVEQLYRNATQPSNLYTPRIDPKFISSFEFSHTQLTKWVRLNVPTMFYSISAFLTQCFLLPLITAIPNTVAQEVVSSSRRQSSVYSDHSDAASVRSTERRLSARASSLSLAPTSTYDLSKLTLADLIGNYATPLVLLDTVERQGSDSKLLNKYLLWLLQAAFPQPLPETWRVLYRSSEHGCSMNRFQYHVFKYNGPTLLLLAAKPTKIEPASMTAYLADVDPILAAECNLRMSDVDADRISVGNLAEFSVNDVNRSGFYQHKEGYVIQPLLFGAFVNTTWKESRNFWGDAESLLLQLNPATHFGVYRSIAGWNAKLQRALEQKAAVCELSSSLGTDDACVAAEQATRAHKTLNDTLPLLYDRHPHHSFCYYNSGISSAGSRASRGTSAATASSALTTGDCTGIGFGGKVGDFRLYVDNLLQRGYFQQSWGDSGNETFLSSSFLGRVKIEFEVVDLEVVGLGGDEAYEQQEAEWNFEEKTAVKRQGVNVKSLIDQGVDSTLLEMAGVHKSYVKDMGLEKVPNWENDSQTIHLEATQRISSQPLPNIELSKP